MAGREARAGTAGNDGRGREAMKGSRYVGIARTLRDLIRSGEYRAGSALPSQRELASMFRTTIMTVRQALSMLEAEGLVQAAHGIGTFVATGTARGRDLRLRGFPDHMRGGASAIITRIVAREYAVRDPRVLKILGTGACCRVDRLRLVGERPVIFQRSYLPSRYRAVIHALADTDSLYGRLNGVCGGVVEGREFILPVVLAAREARMLGQASGSLALRSIRASFDLSSSPILFDEAFIRSPDVLPCIRQTGSLHVFSYGIQPGRDDPELELLSGSFWEDS